MKTKRIKNFEWRYAILVIFILGSFIWVLTLSPMPQPQSYHAFTDTRMFLGIPNILNVFSNILFLIVGLLGIQFCIHHDLVGAKNAWLLFFVGILLVSIGSAYYHWNPNNTTLVWDRLPMTMGFMGLLIALLSEYVDTRLGNNILLLSALLFGSATVVYWHWTDDLRFYLWVQFLPLIIIVLLVSLLKSSYPGQWIILLVLAFYILAKITEIYDTEIYNLTNNLISGHTIKHCLAAISCYFVLLMLRQREIRNNNLII